MKNDRSKRNLRTPVANAKKATSAAVRRAGGSRSPLAHGDVVSKGGKAVLKKYGKKHYSDMGKLGNQVRWGKKKAAKKD